MKTSLTIRKYEIKENTIEVEVGFKNESEIVEVDKVDFENWLWENDGWSPLTKQTLYENKNLAKATLLEYILKPENK